MAAPRGNHRKFSRFIFAHFAMLPSSLSLSRFASYLPLTAHVDWWRLIAVPFQYIKASLVWFNFHFLSLTHSMLTQCAALPIPSRNRLKWIYVLTESIFKCINLLFRNNWVMSRRYKLKWVFKRCAIVESTIFSKMRKFQREKKRKTPSSFVWQTHFKCFASPSRMHSEK